MSVHQEGSWQLDTVMLLSHSTLYSCNSGFFYHLSFTVNCTPTLLQFCEFGGFSPINVFSLLFLDMCYWLEQLVVCLSSNLLHEL